MAAAKKTTKKMKESQRGHAAQLVSVLGEEPVESFAPLEEVLGWSLPSEVVPFADMLANERMPPSSGWYYLYDKHGPNENSAHRDDRGLLRAVELPLRVRTRVIRQRRVQTSLRIALGDTRNLSRVTPDCDRRGSDRHALVEEKQRADPTPLAGRESLPMATAPPRAKELAVCLGQLQPCEPRSRLHRPL
ncbi:Hypothetical protein I5071_1630 (plasmid) [Sandaracinus amylolyticus]|nr:MULTISPECIES: hypothetical protein [Sandaracinus]QRN75833.1 Hypothetical protein MSR10575_89200 [Sandaracinus sp.]UJR87371.1 Hypothetical protein I5071_1630 [Sandaracinus amylolyticus]